MRQMEPRYQDEFFGEVNIYTQAYHPDGSSALPSKAVRKRSGAISRLCQGRVLLPASRLASDSYQSVNFVELSFGTVSGDANTLKQSKLPAATTPRGAMI